MADRKAYVLTIGGIEHTMLLTDEDAKRYGKAAKPAKAGTAANKGGSAANKGA